MSAALGQLGGAEVMFGTGEGGKAASDRNKSTCAATLTGERSDHDGKYTHNPKKTATPKKKNRAVERFEEDQKNKTASRAFVVRSFTD